MQRVFIKDPLFTKQSKHCNFFNKGWAKKQDVICPFLLPRFSSLRSFRYKFFSVLVLIVPRTWPRERGIFTQNVFHFRPQIIYLKWSKVLCNVIAWVRIETTRIKTTLFRNDWFSSRTLSVNPVGYSSAFQKLTLVYHFLFLEWWCWTLHLPKYSLIRTRISRFYLGINFSKSKSGSFHY